MAARSPATAPARPSAALQRLLSESPPRPPQRPSELALIKQTLSDLQLHRGGTANDETRQLIGWLYEKVGLLHISHLAILRITDSVCCGCGKCRALSSLSNGRTEPIAPPAARH